MKKTTKRRNHSLICTSAQCALLISVAILGSPGLTGAGRCDAQNRQLPMGPLLTFQTCQGAPQAVQGLTVGSRVLASPFSMPDNWYNATILKVVPGGYVVRLDQKPGIHYGDLFKIPDTSVKAGNVGPAPPLPPMDANEARRLGIDPGLIGGAGQNAHGNTGVVASAYSRPEYPPQARNDNVKGLGRPPDGHYELYKISGSSFIRIGSIDMKGNTYRGLVAEGAFHPYTMDADGGITWTNGLVGMPPGWKLLKSFYTGLDPGGKPRMEVKYMGIHNTLETADATRN